MSIQQLLAGYGAVAPAGGVKKFLCHFDGANDSYAFTDEAGHALTRYASAVISTGQSKFGGASLLGDRTKGVYSTNFEADFKLSGEFTIDFWMRLTAVDGNYQIPVMLISSDETQFLYFFHLPGNPLTVTINHSGGSANPNSGTFLTADVWRHIALSQDNSGTLRLFIDGVQEHSEPGAGITFTKNMRLHVGAIPAAYGGDGYGFAGNVDEVCIRTGFSHAASFTPPASAYSFP